MGTVSLAARRFMPEPGRRGKALSYAMLTTLRRFHLAASDEFYDRMAIVLPVGILLGGAALIVSGAVLR